MLAYQNYVSTAFANRVIEMGKRLGIDPNWLMITMALETGKTFRAGTTNSTGAVGLIQWTDKGLAELNRYYKTGLTKDALRKMTELEQLVWVERWFAMYKTKIRSLTDTYLSVFAPAYIGAAGSTVLYRSPSAAYNANASLDTTRNGTITISEVAARLSGWIPKDIANNSSDITISAVLLLTLATGFIIRKISQ
jgi:hypothetical protein